MMEIAKIFEKYQAAIEVEINFFLNEEFGNHDSELKEIFAYQLGLKKGEVSGKRVRPILLLLCCEGAGGKWEKALPAAVAVELIHNFSLIHDDIEDNGETRRGKPAVWKKFGLANGLNAGDAMFTSAFIQMHQLRKTYPPTLVLEAVDILERTCLELTKGQQLDLEFENKDEISSADYFLMVGGKTAALLGGACRLGSLLANQDGKNQGLFSKFGQNLGLAFQIYDDWLGIWGDPQETGKSNMSDLLERKKSYPVILGLQESNLFRRKWNEGIFDESDARYLSGILKNIGIEKETIKIADELTQLSIKFLDDANCLPDIKDMLKEISKALIKRTK